MTAWVADTKVCIPIGTLIMYIKVKKLHLSSWIWRCENIKRYLLPKKKNPVELAAVPICYY